MTSKLTQEIFQYFNIDQAWVDKIAQSDSMTAQFDKPDCPLILMATLDSLKRIRFPRTVFRVLTDESPENFVVAVLAFVDRMVVPVNKTVNEYLAGQISPLIAFCAVLIAAVADDGKSQEMLDRISKRLPDDEKAQEIFRNVDFTDNKVDWTQHMIDNIGDYAVYSNNSEKPSIH